MGSIKKDKLYIKAVRYYEEGELEKALQKCDESIAESLKNSASINLKALLLYLKGDLNGAVAQWKINADFNDDQMSKNYMFDSKNDKSKIALYKKGEALLKRLAVDEAIEVLEQCKESDFNAIRVNLALAICYEKKGDYNTSSVYVSKVLTIDRNNENAKALAKRIEEVQGVKLEVNQKSFNPKIIIAALAAIVIIIAGVSIYKASSQPKVDEHPVTVESTNENEDEQKDAEPADNSKNEEPVDGKAKNESLVDYDKLKNMISEKNYDSIADVLSKVDENKVDSSNKTVYLNAKELLQGEEAASYFYKQGSELFNNENYTNAKIEFYNGYKYSQKSYLYQHIVFFKAACDEKLGDNDSAIAGYEEYYRNYKDKDYISETIYKLAILYKDRNRDLSKAYAQELRDEHSDSIYNNDVISGLLDNN